jgi:hypothetical protein
MDFPLVMMDVTNGVITASSKSAEYKAPINQFGLMRTYVSPDFKDVVRISVNSLWSFAVLDLDKEPLVVSHPDTQGRPSKPLLDGSYKIPPVRRVA